MTATALQAPLAAGIRDRIASEQLVRELHDIDDGMWLECRGIDGDRRPRKLTQAMLAGTLRPFGIRPRTIKIRPGETMTRRGYMRVQFEQAWKDYLDGEADTPTPSSVIRHLRKP